MHTSLFRPAAHLTAVLFLLLAGSGCAPKVYTMLQKSYPARPADAEVQLFYLNDPVPDDAEVLGRVEIRDEGTATNCGYTSVVKLAKEATNRAGGDGLHIVWHLIPSMSGGSCHQIAGDMLRLGNPAPVAATTPCETTTANAGQTGSTPAATAVGLVTTPQPRSAASTSRFKRTPFTLEINAGYGMIVSEMETLGSMSGNPRRGLNLNAALQWTSSRMVGAGLRYSGYFSGVRYSDGFIQDERLKLHVHYIAPELVMRQSIGKRWELHETLGVGYASYGESLRGITASVNGFGGHLNFGAECRLSNHFALGLGIAGYRFLYPNQEILTPDEGTTASITLLSINGGLRILF